jgi:hypothetical protein
MQEALLQLFERAVPFTMETPFEIVQRSKSLITDADIADFAKAAPVSTSTADLELFRQAVASLQLKSLQLVVRVQLARLLLRDCQAQKRAVPILSRKRLTQARELLLEVLTDEEEMPLDLIASACYLLSDVNSLLGLDVTQVAAPLNALIDCDITGAMAFFAHEKLCRAYHKLQFYDLAERTAMRVMQLKICFDRQAKETAAVTVHRVSLTRRQCVALFGDTEILTFLYTGHLFGFVGVETDPELEAQLLPFANALLPVCTLKARHPPVLNVEPLQPLLYGFLLFISVPTDFLIHIQAGLA